MKDEFKAREFRKDDGKLTLPDVVTPIFDLAMGERLRIARMRSLWTQEDLAPRLGLNAETLSKLEAGKLAVPRNMFTVSKLEDVFGEEATKFIVLNRYPETFNTPGAHAKWREKRYGTRRPRQVGEHWTRRMIAAGKPVQGSSFMGIDAEVWNEANRIHRERENKRTKKIKR